MHDKLVRISIGKDFSVFEPYTVKFSDIPNIVCQSNVMYSPTQYKDNRRRFANYLGYADLLILDFDEGLPDEQKRFFNQYIGYMVPTRNHMKLKNDIICERYRIILLLKTPVLLDYREYKRLYKHIMRDLNLDSDTSCVDACRFYYSAEQPVSNCIKLNGSQYFEWERYNYRDLQYASLYKNEYVDISNFKDLDVSYLSNLQHSKRYPCPICRLEGLDKKGHHLGFNKDEDYPTCFFDEEHSKILRKIYKQYKYGKIENDIERVNDMVREKCTPDLIKTSIYNPKPTNYSDKVYELYDKMLDIIEKDDYLDLDIETFSEHYVSETLEEAENRLKSDYKYIKGAYTSKCDEYKDVALDPLKNKIRIITLGGNDAVCPFDMYYVREDQKQRILNLIRDKIVVGHNIKFDIRSIIASYGLQYCPKYCYDTMIASKMIHMSLDPEDQQIGHNLAATAYRFTGYKMNKEVDHSWGNDNLTEEQLRYAGSDVKVIRPIFREQVKQFKEIYGPFDTVNYDIKELEFLGPLVNEHPILALEMQTLLEVIRIEHAGIKPNIPMMEKKIDYYNNYIDSVDAELGINCGSAKQCVEFLKKYINPTIDSSNAETLSQYADNPIVSKIIESKAARTRRGLMISMSDTNLHPYDNRIHPSFNQLLSTGRFSCKNPNMQQIPADIKTNVYSTEEDEIVYDTDYAAVELRLVTVVSQDPLFLDSYRKNKDMHYVTAQMLFNKEIPATKEDKEDAEINPNSRFLAKWQRSFAKACFVANTKIVTDNGVINIEDIVPKINKNNVTPSIENSKMLDYHGNYNNVNATFYGSTDKTIRFTLDNDDIIEVTPNHIIVVNRCGKTMKVRADEVLSTDEFIEVDKSLVKIKSIDVINEEKDIYCLEVDNDEHELVLECNSGNRYRIGNCNFGLIYGMHWTTFAALAISQNPNMTEDEAHRYYDQFFVAYKGVKRMIDNAKRIFLTGSDKTVTRWLKNKADAFYKTDKITPFFTQCKTLIGRVIAVDTERKMMNYPVQGSGADTIKLAICKLGYDTRNDNTSHVTINLVHDDTIGQCKVNDFDINSKYFRGSLEWAINFVLRRMFYTPVDQDFCILSMFGEEVFLEKARTLDEAHDALISTMKHDYEKLQKFKDESDQEEVINITTKLNSYYKVLTKLKKVLNK